MMLPWKLLAATWCIQAATCQDVEENCPLSASTPYHDSRQCGAPTLGGLIQRATQRDQRRQTTCRGHDTATPGRVLVIVLGHGEVDRDKTLSAALHTLENQLEPEAFDCLVYVWNSDMPLPDVPKKCEIVIKPGVFMNFLRDVPSSNLEAADWVWLMTDDLTLDVEPEHAVNITRLRQMADANCLDILSPAHAGNHYAAMSPRSGGTSDEVRWVNFIEWQGALVSTEVVGVLKDLTKPDITGCWGYDNLIYSAIESWLQHDPKIGVADSMVMDIGPLGISSFKPEEQAKYAGQHPCGKVLVKDDTVVHVAAHEMVDYWREKGLYARG